MKKILLLMLSVVAALTSCQKSDLDGFGTDGMVDVTVTAAMEGASATTRATAGDGTTVDRCILEVYTGGDLYKRMVAPVVGLETTFDLRLVSSQTYEFLLWADKSNGSAIDDTTDSDNHYETTNGLKEISADYTSYAGNDETRDAFYYAVTKKIDASTVIDAELTRPFGQVNVKTLLKDVPTGMYPASVAVEYTTKVYDKFNVLDGKLSGTETAIVWSAAANVMDGTTGLSASPKYIDLSTDYLFASDDQQDVHNFKMYFYDASGDEITTNENFKNIPVQRNYRTNISGDLLTKQGTINVTIKPEFTDPDNDVKIEEVANVDAANKVIAVADGDVSIKIVEQVSGSNNIELPDVKGTSKVENVTVDFSNLATDTNITIGDSSSEVYDGTINIVVSSAEAAQQVTVNAPAAHVVFYGKAGEVISETSPSTFVVEKGASIDKLTIEKGNVKIYGEVSTIAVDDSNTAAGIIKIFDGGVVTSFANLGSYTLALCVSTDDELLSAIGNTSVKSVTFTDDIVVEDAINLDAVTILSSDFVLDGAGYTLSGYGKKNNILIIGGEDRSVDNVTVKNLTITPSDNTIKNNGVSVYGDAVATFENVTIKEMGKYALVVNASTVTATNLTTSGNGWGGVNVSKGTGSDVANLSPAFTLVSGSIGDSAQIVVDGVDSWSVTTPADETWYEGYYNFGTTEEPAIAYVYNQTEFEDYYAMDGAGTEDDPYLITVAQQLAKIGKESYSDSAYYQLEDDLNMTNIAATDVNFGSSSKPAVATVYIPTFKGVLNGNNHTISNISVGSFIGYLYGTVENLKLDEINNAIGGLTFKIYPRAHVNNCDVAGVLTGTYAPPQTALGFRQGGVAAEYMGSSSSDNAGIIIEYCDVDLIATNGSCIGGILGYVSGKASDAVISHCTVTGNIGSTDVSSSAGIVGQGGDYLTIDYCTNNATISGSCNMAGIINCAYNTIITNCTNNGSVSGVSDSQYISTSSIAGIATAASDATITDCVNNGAVSGSISIGGIATIASGATISGCNNYGDLTATNEVYRTGNGPSCGGIISSLSATAAYPTITNCVVDCSINIPNAKESEAKDRFVGEYVGASNDEDKSIISTYLNSESFSGCSFNGVVTYKK